MTVIAATLASAAAESFLGADKCARCHDKQAKAWKQGPHAGAQTSIGTTTAPKCLSCHTTWAGPAALSRPLPGVQCEACHGPGLYYGKDDVMRNPKLSRLLGLIDLSTPAARAAVCAQCHRGSTTRQAAFDPEKAWRRIAH